MRSILLLSLFACSSSTPTAPADPNHGDTLVVAVSFDPGNANPIVIPYALSFALTDLVVPGLARRVPTSEGLTFEGALAESWSWSPAKDALTYTLREGLTWEDGAPLTSEDVAFTWSLINDPAVASNWHGDNRFVAGVDVISDREVRWRFHGPGNPSLLQASTVRGVLPKHVLEGVDRATLRGHESARHPLASGPFRVAKWRENEQVVLEPNPHALSAWTPKLNRVVLRVLPEYSTRLLELERGSVDLMIGVEIQDIARLQQDPRLELVREPASGMQYVGYNLSNPLFADLAVREGLTRATDRDKLIADLLTAEGQTYGSPCVGTVSPLYGGVPADLAPYAFDEGKAKALLSGAGWSDTDGDGVLDKDGVPLHFSLMVQIGEAQLKRIAVFLQAAWRAVGVQVELELIEPTRFSQRAREKQYEAILWGFGGTPVTDPSMKWRTGGQYNWMGFSDPEVDRLIDAGIAASDPAEAREAFAEVQRRVYAAQPATFLFWTDEVVAVDRRFRDTVMDSYSPLRHAERWWVPVGERRYKR